MTLRYRLSLFILTHEFYHFMLPRCLAMPMLRWAFDQQPIYDTDDIADVPDGCYDVLVDD
jgi:hypothetical protein